MKEQNDVISKDIQNCVLVPVLYWGVVLIFYPAADHAHIDRRLAIAAFCSAVACGAALLIWMLKLAIRAFGRDRSVTVKIISLFFTIVFALSLWIGLRLMALDLFGAYPVR